MGRCPKKRHCRLLTGPRSFKPQGVPYSQLAHSYMAADQLEAIRLCDLEGHSQIEAALAMGISRATVQRLLAAGRKLLVEMIVYNRSLTLE